MDAAIDLVVREQQAYRNIKNHLDKIGDAEDDILDHWIGVGEELAGLKEQYPKFDGSFISNCRLHGIVLTKEERAAAMWWAKLSSDQRDTARSEFPDRLTPDGLRRGCRETHPDWSKQPVSSVVGPSHRGKNSRSKAKTASPSIAPDDEEEPPPPTKVSAAAKKRIAKQLEEEERERQREERRAHRQRREEAEARRAAEDRRPCQTPPATEIMMFGVRMWPDPDRIKLGEYDYDQMFYAIHQFWGFYKLLLGCDLTTESRVNYMRSRVMPTIKFIGRRLRPGPEQTEMTNYYRLQQRLADLYWENPTGEVKLPPDWND